MSVKCSTLDIISNKMGLYYNDFHSTNERAYNVIYSDTARSIFNIRHHDMYAWTKLNSILMVQTPLATI